MENNQFSDEENASQESVNGTVSNVSTTNETIHETVENTTEVNDTTPQIEAKLETLQNEPLKELVAKEETLKDNISEDHVESFDQEDDFSGLDKPALFAKVEKINAIQDIEGYNQYVNKVNEAFKFLSQIEYQSAIEKFIADGGVKEEFHYQKPLFDSKYEELYKTIKEKIYKQKDARELSLQKNLVQKQRIINDVRDLLQNSTDISVAFHKLHELQSEWRSVGQVPQTDSKLVWDNYKFLVDQFYKFIEINKELKELDYRKNLELKVDLCEKAENLFLAIADTSIKVAVQTVKQLHQEWKEIGHVPNEHSEPIWVRFKTTCDKVFDIINESIGARQEEWAENLKKKQEVITKMTEVLNQDHKSHQDWQAASDKVLEFFEEWKTIKSASKSDNDAIWENYKTIRTAFFDKKENFYQVLRTEQDGNLQKKVDLCVQVESLQDSTNWKTTTDAIVAIQKEWKNIGPVPRKRSDELWARFKAACDNFFNKKQQFYQGQGAGQEDNLKLKEEILEELKSFALLNDGTDFDRLREIQNKWFAVGFVPMKDKDRLAKDFSAIIDPFFETVKKSKTDNRTSFNNDYAKKSFKEVRRDNSSSIKEQLKKLEQNLLQLETNASFFSGSNNENPFKQAIVSQIEEVQKKIDAVKESIKAEDLARKQVEIDKIAKENETVLTTLTTEVIVETPSETPGETK